MGGAYNVAQGFSGNHTVLDLGELTEGLKRLDIAIEQPEGWYTAKQIKAALGMGENKCYDLIREACKSGKMEFAPVYWTDWDNVNRPHRCYRIKEDTDGTS